jgi:hypothetical protein
VELQDYQPVLLASGIAAYAISYDPLDVLAQLARGYGVTYPLLSDRESRVIRALGLLNTNMPAGHPWHGVPYPGTFLLDEEGRIAHKSFYADHRVRDSVARLLEDGFGVPPDLGGASEGTLRSALQSTPADRARPRVAVRTERIEAVATLSAGTVRPGQVHTLRIEVRPRRDTAPAQRFPELAALAVEVAPVEGVETGPTVGERGERGVVLRTPIIVRRREDVVLHARVRAAEAGDGPDGAAADLEAVAFDLPLRYVPNAAPAGG